MFVYIRPGVPWDPSEFIQVLQNYATIILLYGDFNVHCETWVDSRTDARGEGLFDVMASVKLVTLYNGRPTFVHPGVSDSVLDVTFASPVSRLRVLW